MRKSKNIDIKTIQIKGEKLPKAIKLEIIIAKFGATWYEIRQRDLDYDQTFIAYPLTEVIKKVRNDLYEKLVKITEKL